MRAYDFAAGSIINDDRLTIAHERVRLPTGTYRARRTACVSVREFWDCARACVRACTLRKESARLARPLGVAARTCEDEIRYVLLSSALLHPSAPSPSSPLPPSLFMRFPEPFPGYGTLLRRFPRLLSSSPSPRTSLPPLSLSLSPSLTYSLSPDDACKHRSRMAQAANFREDVLSRAAYGRRLYQSSAGNSEGKSRSCEWCGESERKKGSSDFRRAAFSSLSGFRRSCCRSRSRTGALDWLTDDLT